MSKPQGPCLGCEDREPTCHAHCIAYKAFRAKLDAEREEERKRRAEEKAGFTAHFYDAIRRKRGER